MPFVTVFFFYDNDCLMLYIQCRLTALLLFCIDVWYLLLFTKLPLCSGPFFLIYPKGEMVDRVEYHVSQATTAVQSGRIEMKLAETYQSKARKVGFTPRITS